MIKALNFYVDDVSWLEKKYGCDEIKTIKDSLNKQIDELNNIQTDILIGGIPEIGNNIIKLGSVIENLYLIVESMEGGLFID